MASPFVPRSKDQRAKLDDNRGPRNHYGNAITLTCGHRATTLPPVSNPDQWFCCGKWRRAK